MTLRIAVFGENRHEKVDPKVQEVYPEGMHTVIAEALRSHLAADGIDAEVRIALLDDIDQSLSEEALAETDVLTWWGHMAHDEVSDEVAERVQKHVLSGMGLVVLHSGHWLVDDRAEEDGGTGATFGATASCELSFAELSDAEIDAYVATGEPLGVAGGFTLDGLGGPFIERVHGDPHAVVGLSLPLLRRMLAEIDLGVHELWEDTAGDAPHTPASS